VRKFLFIVAFIIAALAGIWFAPAPVICSWDFHNSLWGPANMVLHGLTPYTFHPPYSPPYWPVPAVWMPQSIGAFIWLGMLPCSIASKLWFVVEIGGLLAVVWILAGRRLPSRGLFAASLLLIFLFPPLYYHFLLGQYAILFLTLVLLVVYVPGIWIATSLILAIALAKPQLGILVYPGILIWVWRTRGTGAMFRLFIFTVLSVTLLTLPLFFGYPAWPNDFLYVTTSNLGKPWELPTLYVLLTVGLGRTGFIIWLSLFLAVACLCMWLWLKRDAKIAVLISLALTPVVTTYASSWDFVLLLPALIGLLLHVKTTFARVMLVGGAFLLDIIIIATRWHNDISDGSQWWIPLALLIIMAMGLWSERWAVRDKKPATMP